jgi:hypothetical protein
MSPPRFAVYAKDPAVASARTRLPINIGRDGATARRALQSPRDREDTERLTEDERDERGFFVWLYVAG